MKSIIIVILLVVFSSAFAQSYSDHMSDFEKYKQEQNQQEENYYKFAQNFKAYQDEHFIKYESYIEDIWGDFKESSPKTWVGYSEDFSGRTSVDFDSSKVVVEVVVDADSDDAEVKQKLEALTKKILEEKDETGTRILEGQVASPKDSNKAISPSDAKEVVEQAKIVEKEINGKKVYSINLDLVSDSDKKRIAKYEDLISKYCKEAGIEPALALAIIKTESCFNPRAYNRSGNAYGMMQIVPKYAGRTMNRILYKKDKEPGSKTLFDPEKNLRMGINFLGHLKSTSWKKIKNEVNQRYCVICSYNGGSGAIYIALAGKTSKIPQEKWDAMMDLLNSDNNKKVYNLLHTKSWEETRHYIKVVEERYKQYLAYNEKL
jgi:membrane-bound lytic murein transglycosylase C